MNNQLQSFEMRSFTGRFTALPLERLASHRSMIGGRISIESDQIGPEVDPFDRRAIASPAEDPPPAGPAEPPSPSSGSRSGPDRIAYHRLISCSLSFFFLY